MKNWAMKRNVVMILNVVMMNVNVVMILLLVMN